MVITNCSPALLVTVHTPSPSLSVHGGLIQFSGLYARSSAWTDTDPSALSRSSRGGTWQVSGQPADVVDAAPRDDKPHGPTVVEGPGVAPGTGSGFRAYPG